MDMACELNKCFGHDHDDVSCMDWCRDLCILQESNQVKLCSFLQSHDHMHLEAAGHTFLSLWLFCRLLLQEGTLAVSRSSVLLWYCQISQGGLLSLAGTSGASL